ncbi:5167_t:CDS:2 [Diversispora eburnea]|uniref:5167_t:CDS:1 n=1 Tax=Diversispora eburnea TaxID=1213867 RepID=A0A9N8ZG66_9GLOM|nr:5167_t:CDS:2 [Diversispora eburnea]
MNLAYVEILETNKALKDELNSEDSTIITQESEIQELKSQVNTYMTQRLPQLSTIEIRQNYNDIQRHLDDVRLCFQNQIQVPFS